MSSKLEVHHILWTKAEWTKKPIAKQVRQMAAFLIDLHHPNHRLLHASMEPPSVPNHETLHNMRDLALGGLQRVVDNLNHPIIDHIQAQLEIIEMDPEEAQYLLDVGDYIKYKKR